MFVSVLAFFATMAVLFGTFGALIHAGSKLRDGGVGQVVITIGVVTVTTALCVAPWLVMERVGHALGVH